MLKVITKHVLSESFDNEEITTKCTFKKLSDSSFALNEEVLNRSRTEEDSNSSKHENQSNEKNEKSLLQTLLDCRIPSEDCKLYLDSFVNLGFEDFQAIKEDMKRSTLDSIGMKAGHMKRFLKLLDDSNSNLGSTTIQTLDSKATFENNPKFEVDKEFLKAHESPSEPKDFSLKNNMDSFAEYSSKTVFMIREIGRGYYNYNHYNHYHHYYLNHYHYTSLIKVHLELFTNLLLGHHLIR